MRGPLLWLLVLLAIACQPTGGGGGGYPHTPGEVVGTYYDALGRGLTRQAYELLGPDWQAAVPYGQFSQEFRALRVSDYKNLEVIETSDRLAKVRVAVRALPGADAPRYYSNTITLLRDPGTGHWVIGIADSREIPEEDYQR